jgi:hypothetical protein
LAKVQNKSQDSADSVYSKVKGAVDVVENQTIQLNQIHRFTRGVTPVFIGLALLSFAYGVVTNPDFITAVSKYITPEKPQRVSLQPKVFAHPDVAREGRMFNIKVTVTPNASGGGSYNIDFYWTGSGGTWSGQQTAIISFLGAQDQSLQSVSVPIDRSGCFYGGGNHQTSNGALSIAPDLITHIGVTLSEVHNRTEGGC